MLQIVLDSSQHSVKVRAGVVSDGNCNLTDGVESAFAVFGLLEQSEKMHHGLVVVLADKRLWVVLSQHRQEVGDGDPHEGVLVVEHRKDTAADSIVVALHVQTGSQEELLIAEEGAMHVLSHGRAKAAAGFLVGDVVVWHRSVGEAISVISNLENAVEGAGSSFADGHFRISEGVPHVVGKV